MRAQGTMTLARGTTLCVIATVVFAVGIGFLIFVARVISRFIDRQIRRLRFLKFKKIDFRPHLGTLAEQLTKLTCLVMGVCLVCLYVAFVFRQFPLTAPWGSAFQGQLLGFGHGLLRSTVEAVPGLITAVIILIITRWLAAILSKVLSSIGDSSPGATLSPETAKATRRIAVVMVWLFGIVLAYPYLPGSGSDAFKGVSVLLGLMVSLGSAGMVNQVMSGFVLLYSGSVRTGEYVQVGQIEGKITEIGILAVKLLTPKREFITIPNAVMLGNPTTNFSRLADRVGVPISTQVTIGYDTPWRQVHTLLLKAAQETEGVMDKPPAKVIQKALSDWYPEYILTCYVTDPEHRVAILSELNSKVQDAFNEAGVQIMSPHFREQPKDPVVIPKDRWFPPMSPRQG